MLAYFLPTVLIAAVVMAGVSLAVSWLTGSWFAGRGAETARALGTSVQEQVHNLVQGKLALVSLLAQSPEVREGLAAGEEQIARVESRLKAHLPKVSYLRLIPGSWEDQKAQAILANSYLAEDMFREVVRKGTPALVEVLDSATDERSFAIVVPVKEKEKVAAVIFAGFPLSLITRSIGKLTSKDVVVTLEQVLRDNSRELAASSRLSGKNTSNRLPIPGTRWQVRYASLTEFQLEWPLLAALIGGGAVIVLGSGLLSYRRLAKHLQADMGTMVTLMDATLKRTGSAIPSPHLREVAPAMEMLARYAQATYRAASAGHAAQSKAGMPQMVVEEVESEEPQLEVALQAEQLPLSLFHASALRGLSSINLNEEIAQAVGLATGTLVRENGGQGAIVARDNRPSSDAYSAALVAGILASGCDVLDLGVAPTPLLSFALRQGRASSGVMVTGGHNSPDYNGFKIYLNGQPLNERQLLEIRERILTADFARGGGKLETLDVSGEYISHISEDIQLVEPLKVVVDGGNGVAGPLALRLLESLGCEVVPLFCEPDAGFPNHPADPADPANLTALAMEVQAHGAALGVALDVDGDALGVIDEQGGIVPADRLLMLLAGDIIRRNPGADVIYDVACSAALPEYILANGGRPIMWKTGHANMQSKLAETGGLLAGEFSGHIYIKDRWFGFDDALYVMARLLEFFSMEAAPVSSAIAALSNLVGTPWLRLDTAEGKAEQVVTAMAQQGDLGEADVNDLDGLRLEYAHAWGLVRSSNTQPALRFRFEAENGEELQRVQQRFRELLAAAAPELIAPF